MLSDLVIIEKRFYKGALQNDEWSKSFSCWASVDCVKAEEYNGMSSSGTLINATYKIRNTNNMKVMLEEYNTREYRLVHKGNTFDIKSILEEGKHCEFLRIHCTRRC